MCYTYDELNRVTSHTFAYNKDREPSPFSRGKEARMRNGIFITGYEILGEYPTTEYKVNENKSNRK